MNGFDVHSPVSKLQCSEDAFKIKSPCRIQIFGPSQSGKSELIIKLVENRTTIFENQFQRIIYLCPIGTYGNRRDYIHRFTKVFKGLEYQEGIKGLSSFAKYNTVPILLVLDDLQQEFINSPDGLDLIIQVKFEAHDQKNTNYL